LKLGVICVKNQYLANSSRLNNRSEQQFIIDRNKDELDGSQFH